MQTSVNTPMNMDTLSAELERLGCNFGYCGVHHGFIFEPAKSGGLNIEYGSLHFWDYGVNVFIDLEAAHQKLASLPNNAGDKAICKSLLEIEPE